MTESDKERARQIMKTTTENSNKFSEIKNGIKTIYVLTSNGGREAISEEKGFPLTEQEKSEKAHAAFVADCED